MSERRRSAFWGVLFGYSSVAISLVRNILLVPIFLHSIPLTEYGAWLATGGALTLMLVNDFGLGGVVTQKASAAVGADDMRLFASLSGSALCIGGILALLLSAISCLVLPFLSAVNDLPEEQKRVVNLCFYLATAANAAGIVAGTAGSLIRSLQKAILAGSIIFIADIANIVFTIVAIVRGAGLYAIAGGLLVRSLLALLGCFFALALLLQRRFHIPLNLQWRSVRELFVDSSRFFVTSIAMKLQAQANVFLVGSILGPATAAVYSLTVRAHETVLMLAGQINSALVPSITHLVGSGNLARFRAVILRILLTMGVVTAFAMTLTVIMNANFLKLWVGESIFGGQKLSILTAFALFVSSIGYVAYDALIAQGKFRLVSTVFGITSLMHVVLLAILLNRGLWLAPIATTVSAATWGLIFWRDIAAEFAITAPERRDLLGQLALLIAVSAVTAGAFLAFYPSVDNWSAFVLQGVICSASVAVAYWYCSRNIREAAKDELRLTLRLFKSR